MNVRVLSDPGRRLAVLLILLAAVLAAVLLTALGSTLADTPQTVGATEIWVAPAP